MYKVVLDTNSLLKSVSRRSSFGVILDKLHAGMYELYITNDILLEYEETIAAVFSRETAELVVGAFYLLPNVRKTDIHFFLNLIAADPDDNKFVDCAFAANAHFIVTDDRHFNVVKSTAFPVINVISTEEFKLILQNMNSQSTSQ